MRLAGAPRFAATAMAAALCAWPQSASAQDAAAAGAQFDRGLVEMQAGRYETGCPALAESYRLDPRPGTLFTLAECHAKWGKVASALGYYEDYLTRFERMSADQRAAQRGREKIAAQQRDAMRIAVPKLTLKFTTPPPQGTVVKRDGVELGPPSLGIALPIDPGDHVVTVQAPGGAAHEQRISLAQGDVKELTLVVQHEIEPPPPPPPPPPPEPSSTRTWAFVAGGIGVAGLVVGGATGVLVLGKKSTIDAHCVGAACDAEGKRAGDSAKTLGIVSTIGFGVGIAGLATGVVLLLASPSTTKQGGALRPEVRWLADGAVAGVGGAW